MNYPTLNGHQFRGPGGDGRALAALMLRAGWASFLTRDGERVDPRDITDIHQLAKDLAHDHVAHATPTPAATRRYQQFQYFKPAVAVSVRNVAHAQLRDIIAKLAAAPSVEEVERQQLAAIANAASPGIAWCRLARDASRPVR